jgi:hypothetical protein
MVHGHPILLFGGRALAAFIILLGASAHAQKPAEPAPTEARTMQAERMAPGESIRLDGVLDEPIWSRAQPASDFIQQEPALGEKPTERTEVRIAFDEDRLYMGITCHDSEPDKLLGNTRKRDEFLSADDRFMWTMDTFLNQQTGYFFEMNPSGLMADALMGPGGTNSREWDGIWNARVKRSEIGWVIEIEIPFRSLAFDPTAEAWGVNFQRTVRRKNEESLWMGHQRNQGLRRMSNAGRLVGLRGLSRSRGLEIKPYVAGASATAPGASPARPDETSADIGLDIAYNLTPSLRAVATINTDFAETEVDQRRLNLTRFPLQFPEKRGFFLDGATFFDFPVTAFFSRRIGLDAAGQPQRVDGGARLTGQAGRFDLGALWVRTGRVSAAPGEDFVVGRVRRRVFRQSYIGGLYTGRSTRDSTLDMRHTLAADFRLATSSFAGRRNLEATGFFLRTLSGAGAPRGQSDWFGARVAYPNDVWEASVQFQEQQRNVAPAVGFLQRTAYRALLAAAEVQPPAHGTPVDPPALVRGRVRDLHRPRGPARDTGAEVHSDPCRDASSGQHRGERAAHVRAAGARVRDQPRRAPARGQRVPLHPLSPFRRHGEPPRPRLPAAPRMGRLLLGHATGDGARGGRPAAAGRDAQSLDGVEHCVTA